MIAGIKIHLQHFGVRSLLAAINGKLTRNQHLLQVRKPGIEHSFFLRFPSSDIQTFTQIFVRNDYDFDVTRSPRVIVDAGANIGLASIYFSNKFPDARIIAIEPEASNFEVLKLNAAPYDNIVPVYGALWNRNEELNLVDPSLGEWGFMTHGKDEADRSRHKVCHTVTGMTVDNIMKDHGIDRIDILKIDIEGAEREVFMEPSSWIGKVDALIVELHERMKEGCNRSFYRSTNGFDDEWCQGENVYLTRSSACLTRRKLDVNDMN